MHPESKITPEQKEWIISGSEEEDTPPRWLNHFYDPIHQIGWTGLKAGSITPDAIYILAVAGNGGYAPASAVDWLNNNSLQDNLSLYGGNHSWQKGLDDYAVGNTEEAYITLGHALHLLEDMAVPEHTRDDTHAPIASAGDEGSPFEDHSTKWNLSNIKELNIISNIQAENLTPLIKTAIADYLTALAEYSNKYFFSKDTINDEKYQLPKILKEDGNFGYGIDESGLEIPLAKVNRIWSNTNKQYEVFFDILNKPAYKSILDVYFDHLSKQAVLYGAGVIDLFNRQASDAIENKGFATHLIEYDFSFLPIKTVSFIGEGAKIINATQSFLSSILNTAQGIMNVVVTPINSLFSNYQSGNQDSNSMIPPAETAIQPSIELISSEENISSLETIQEEINQQELSVIQNQLDDISDIVDNLVLRIAALSQTPSLNNNDIPQESLVETPASLNLSNVNNTQTNINNVFGGGGGVSQTTGENRFYPKILINELQLASASSSHEEFIELYNPNATAVDLNDWYLQKKTANGNSFTTFVPKNLFAGKNMPARGYFLIAHSSSTFAADIFTDYGIADNNSFVLKNPDGGIVDKVGWGSANDCNGSCVTNPADDQSIQRKFINGEFMNTDNNASDFALEICPSPKAESRFCGGNIVSQSTNQLFVNEGGSNTNHVLISEIMPGLSGDAKSEWIELYNPTNQSVNLENWSLKRKNTLNTTTTYNLVVDHSFRGVIAPKGFFLIGSQEWGGDKDLFYSQVSNHLAQTDDVVLLLDDQKNVIDEVGYVDVDFGQSLERSVYLNGICVSAQNAYEFSGNGCDTDSQNDFNLRSAPNPQNSENLLEPRSAPSVPNWNAIWSSSTTEFIFSWEESADASGATSTVLYQIMEGNNFVDNIIGVQNFNKRINEFSRNYEFTFRVFDKDGLGSSTSSLTYDVPSPIKDLYFYRDPRSSSSDYLVDFYYDQYPFVANLYWPTSNWKAMIFYLNGAAVKEDSLNTASDWQSTNLNSVLFIKSEMCVGGDRNSTSLILPDTSEQCGLGGGLNNIALPLAQLEDNHLIMKTASSTNDIIFTPSDYLTIVYYALSDAGGGNQTLKLVGVDMKKYFFQDNPPISRAPGVPTDLTFSFDSGNMNLGISWLSVVDPDTLDGKLTYQMKINDGQWENVVLINGLDQLRRYAKIPVEPNKSYDIGIRARDDFGNFSSAVSASYTTVAALAPFNLSEIKWGHLNSSSTSELSFEFNIYPFISNGGYPWSAMIFYLNQLPQAGLAFAMSAPNGEVQGINSLVGVRYFNCNNNLGDEIGLFMVESDLNPELCYRKTSVLNLTGANYVAPVGGTKGKITLQVLGDGFTAADYFTIGFYNSNSDGFGTFNQAALDLNKYYFQE